MERHEKNARALAELLSRHPKVSRVHYPGLASHPQHALAARQASGFGGMISIVPGDGSLDFATIIARLASYGYEGWFVVEAEQDPKISPPLEMAKKGHAELMRLMASAGYEVVQ